MLKQFSLQSRGLIVISVFTLLLSACGGGAPSASTSTNPGPSAPVVDHNDLAGSMNKAELALRAEDRARAGLVNLGPGATEFVAAMDASGSRALAGLQPASASLEGQIAAVGPFAVDHPFAAVADISSDSVTAWALMIGALDDFAQGKAENGTVPEKPETIEVAGNTGTITTTMTLNAVTNGSQLAVDLSVKTKGQVVDKATGAILYSVDSSASGHIDVNFCPDAGGQAMANVKLTSSETYSGGAAGAGKGSSKEFSGSVAITVGDDAKITKIDGTAQGSEDAKGGIAPAGGDQSGSSTRTAGGDIASDGDGNRLPGADRAPGIKLGGEGSTLQEQGQLWGSMTLFVETMVTAAAKEAEKLWSDGKCVEIIVDPEGGDIDANETKDVTAKLKHKIEGNELNKPIVATLANLAKLDPAGEKQPAPATVSYTAGPNEGDYGLITFKSVSNRGIAEKTVTFTVGGQQLNVGLTGKMTSSVAGISFSTSVAAPVITLTRQADGTYAGSGPVTIGIELGLDLCEPFSEQGTLKLIATRDVPTDPAQPSHWTVAYDPTGQVAFQGSCHDSHGTTVPLDAFTGADGPTGGFMLVLGDVVFDAEGGAQHVKLTKALGASSNTIDATMTVTIVPGSK